MTVFKLRDVSVGGGLPPVEEDLRKRPEGAEVQEVEGQVPATEIGAPEPVKGSVKEIVLKGPLSHAYTEALNLLLSKKDGSADGLRQESVQQALFLEQLAEEEGAETADTSYVYAYDGKTMSLGDVAEMTDLYMDRGANEEAHPGFVYTVVENPEAFSRKHPRTETMGYLTYHAEKCARGEIFFSRKALLRHLGFSV